VAETRLRIVSDLHYAETGSRLRNLSALEPLFDGADHVVFNGDSVEARFLDLDPRTAQHKAEFDAFAAAHRGRVTLVTGNHDPAITDRHHLDLAEGAVFVTHGDTMFADMAPWGWEAKYFRAEQARLMAAIPAHARGTWETRVRVCKEATMAIRDLSPRFPGPSSHPWRRRLRFLVAIRRVDKIVESWWRMPGAAAALAERFRPQARVIIVGHTHKPGLWRRRGRIVLNTGAFVPFLGAMAVDLVGRRLEARPIAFMRGSAHAGRPWRSIDLDAPDRARDPLVPGR
jgi:predicted phosphodiesterase